MRVGELMRQRRQSLRSLPYYAQGPKIELSGGALPILPQPATSMAFTDFHRQLSFFGMGVPKIRPTGDLSHCAKMTKIESGLLMINLKTAKALGLEIPPTLLARAPTR